MVSLRMNGQWAFLLVVCVTLVTQHANAQTTPPVAAPIGEAISNVPSLSAVFTPETSAPVILVVTAYPTSTPSLTTISPTGATTAPLIATSSPTAATVSPTLPAATDSPSLTPTIVAPITPAPITPAPITPAPFTPPPITPAPITPVPTTIAPSVAATEAPVTFTPTTAPSEKETEAPSNAPSVPETLSPTGAPSIPDATPSPTTTPTPIPSMQASDSPSVSPPIPGSKAPSPRPTTARPSTSQPSSSSPTKSTSTTDPSSSPQTKPTSTTRPSSSPPAKPTSTTKPSSSPQTESTSTSQPSSSPQTKPTTKPTLAPNSILVSPPTFIGLSMTFNGLAPMTDSSLAIWAKTTGTYVSTFFSTHFSDVTDVIATFTVTKQNPPRSSRRFLGGQQHALQRELQTSTVTLTFNQQVRYQTTTSSVKPEQVVAAPFANDGFRAEYVKLLNQTCGTCFGNLISVSPIVFPNESKSGLGMWAIIGIGVGGGVGLLLLLFICYYFVCCKKKENPRKGYASDVSGDAPVASVPGRMNALSDDISTLADPTTDRLNVRTSSPGGYGDQSVATVDYDYSKAYGGGGEASVVSSSGGTFGSGTHGGLTTSGLSNPAGAAALGASFSDDGSFEEGVFRNSNAANTKEVLLDIYAPPGKLGVVIDTPDDGAPVVHAIKDSSVIADKLQVGDKLVAVDDEDVRTMTAIKVSKLISRKSANATRKLSVVRTTILGE